MKKIVYSLITCLTMLFALQACSPDDYSLGKKDVTSEDLVEGIAFTITHDQANPNIVYLESKMPDNYQVLWNHPQGRSQGKKVTLKFPFAGTYQVQMGVETRGGVVYGDYVDFTIDDFCADFVSDPLWETLTGGVGHSKTWYLDLDENAVCRYFVGPLYFYGTADNWNTVTLGQTVEGDSWSWGADWAGNGSWLFGSTGAIDFGSMTFSLEGGANIIVDDKAHNRVMNGTFQMDTDNHTMKLTDAEILHDPGRDAIVTQWGNITILALDENHMQLAVLRDNDPNEGPCLLSYNFISEDYKNNWSPDNAGDTEVFPSLAEDWRDFVEPKTAKQMTFKFAEEDWFDIMNLDGTNKGITGSYTANDAISDIRLEFNRNDNSYKYTAGSGDVVSGTYTLSDDGVYTFSDGIIAENLSSDGTFQMKANADNTLRIMQVVLDDYTGGIKDLWLGSEMKDDQGNRIQYMGYHLVPVVAGAGDVKRYTGILQFFDTDWVFQTSENVFITGDGSYTFTINGSSDKPYGIFLDVAKIFKDNVNVDLIITSIKADGKDVPFDDSVIDRGVGDDPGTARRYILNPWGATAADAPNYVFTSSLEVTIKVVMDSGSNVMNPEATE